MTSSTLPAGWLARQLPRALGEDDFMRRFLRGFEEIAGSLHARVEGFEHNLDVRLAPPEFVRWMGGWLGLAIEALPEAHQRSLVRAAGPLFAWRGTRQGLQGLLEAFTRGEVEIEDGGGVFAGGKAPPNPGRIVVRLAHTGPLDERQLALLIRQEIPASAWFELSIGGRPVGQPGLPASGGAE